MNIGYICKRGVVMIDSAGTLLQAADLMREHHVGALIVTTETPDGPRVSGVVTDRDLVIDVMARGLDGADVEIGQVASANIVSVSAEDDLSSAIEAMHEGGVRRLLVTNAEQRLIGIISFDDLMQACASEIEGLAKVIRNGMEREAADTLTPTPPIPLPLRIPAMGTAGWGKAMA
jgi:CBS domain-containing protein